MSEKVTIKLHLNMMERGHLYFEKPAPKLPSCLNWQPGMMLEIDPKEQEFSHVEFICVNTDGSVDLCAEFDMPGGDWGEMYESKWWEDRGWKLGKQGF